MRGPQVFVFKGTSKCLKQVLKVIWNFTVHVQIHTSTKNSSSAIPIFMNPTCTQHYVQTIPYTEFHSNQTIHVEGRDKNLIMPSLECLTAHIFEKVAINEHYFVGNFLYQICFQIGRNTYKMLENFHLCL